MMRAWMALPLLFAAASASAGDAPLPPDEAALKAHVTFLASDLLRGRDPGSPEFAIASEYMASEMLAAGLVPAGEKGGWYQDVKLIGYRAREKGSVSLTGGAGPVALAFGEDFISYPNPRSADFSITGNLVFAGYGIVDAAAGIDEYRGLDVKGKIVALLAGVPKTLSPEEQAFFDDRDERARIAEAHGAIGVVMIESAARNAEFPFAQSVGYWNSARTTWGEPDGTPHVAAPGAPAIAYFSIAGAEKLFAGAHLRFRDVLAAEKTGRRLPTGALARGIAAAVKTETMTVDSRNVIGRIEGSDPALRDQYVILSAHLDHIGIGGPPDGDQINNGAMDNAVGNAAILEVARAFQASGVRPKRSILFLSLTGEERGLLGSDYFAHHPTVPARNIVADLNIDMPILTYPLKDLVVVGGERSTLGAVVAAAAATEGLATVPDPTPEEMFFVRSDHYSFVKAGVPAVSIDTGPGGEGAKAIRDFLDHHYHRPSDEATLPFDWASAAKYTRVAYAAARALADGERVRWSRGDFFGVRFDGYGAK